MARKKTRKKASKKTSRKTTRRTSTSRRKKTSRKSRKGKGQIPLKLLEKRYSKLKKIIKSRGGSV